MSTRCTFYYGKAGHIFREMGDGCYYWQKRPGARWKRLPLRKVWLALDIWLARRRQARWERGGK